MTHGLLKVYRNLLKIGTPLINRTLEKRLDNGKEDPARINERRGIASIARPTGDLIWIHVASVGEAQSILILIEELLAANDDLSILVTSVTRNSALMLAKQLPERAMHQYAPFDHPDWVQQFLDHWQPTMALWIESELWPNMLNLIHKRHIPAALINARLSPTSFKRWRFAKGLFHSLINSFAIILTQTKNDQLTFEQLGCARVVTTGNIKYCAKPLAYQPMQAAELQKSLSSRKAWIYASTHVDEELIAARVHLYLKNSIPHLCTFIAPRHPERTESIIKSLAGLNLTIQKHSDGQLPQDNTDLYIIDTIGDLGLFYSTLPVAMIGRSLSLDGGGGHNPLEAMRLHALILFGKHVQNLQDIYDDIEAHNAGVKISNEDELKEALHRLLTDNLAYSILAEESDIFIKSKDDILKLILDELEPLFLETGIIPPRSHIVHGDAV